MDLCVVRLHIFFFFFFLKRRFHLHL
jgi:hypothetical protein